MTLRNASLSRRSGTRVVVPFVSYAAGAARTCLIQIEVRRCEFTEVLGGPEREECWRLLVAAYPNFTSYQELTERKLPVGLLTPA